MKRLVSAAVAALGFITACHAQPRTGTPSQMANQPCKVWTEAKGNERSEMIAWLAGFLDGEIAAIDNYGQPGLKMPPIAVDVREMDNVCKSNPSTSIRQNAIDEFVNGHP